MRSRKAIWLILWLISLVLVSIRGGAVSYGLFFFFTLIPVISYLYLIAVMLQFGIYQDLENRNMTVGEPQEYYFTLQNEGFLSISSIRVELFSNFSYVEELPDDITFELLPGESYTYHTRMIAKYRGTIRVGVRRLILTDFLRLFSVKYKLPSTLEAIVSPRVPDAEEMFAEEEFSASFRREASHKQNEPDMTVRDYVTGDSLRSIHWKASAASGKLMAKPRTGETQTAVSVFFSTKRRSRHEKEYLPTENKILETVLGMTQACLLKGQSVRVCFPKLQTGNVVLKSLETECYADFDCFYDEISQVMFGDADVSSALTQWADEMGQRGTAQKMIAVLHTLSESELGQLCFLNDIGCDIMVVLVDAPEEVQLPFGGVSVVRIRGEEDAR